jgi:flagellar protein FlbD
MVLLTRLNGQELVVDSDLVERAEPTPDTVLTLVDSTKYVVAESVQEVIDRVRTDQASVLARPGRLRRARSAASATIRA